MNTTESVNILMVDDQPGKLLTYQAILQDLGENLISATSGREALELLLSRDVAVILMDVSMPELDGFELADMIRQHPRFQKDCHHFHFRGPSDGYRSHRRDTSAERWITSPCPLSRNFLRAKVSVFADLYRKTRELELLNSELEETRAGAHGTVAGKRKSRCAGSTCSCSSGVVELETIMKVLPVGVSIAHDPHCRFVTGNAALKELLGLEHRENLSPQSYENKRRKL